MRQGDGSDLLGADDARGASIGIIYVAPTDDRPSVLEAILMQDKLGRKQVAVVLPENSRAFQRPVDFDGLKNMRRGLKTEIIFVAPGVPGPAEFARQRRFTVYTSLESYATALRAEPPGNGNGNAKKGLLLFARKPKLVPDANAPAPLENFDHPGSPQPLPVPIIPVDAPAPMNAAPTNENKTRDEPAPIVPLVALGGAGIVDARLDTDDEWSQSAPTSDDDAHSRVPPIIPLAGDEDVKPISRRPRYEPLPIAMPSQTGAKTKPLATGATGNNAAASPSVRNGNTGKRAVVGVAAAGAVGAGAAALAATGHAPVSGGAQPPIRGNAGGTGGGAGGGGRSRRSTRQLLAILLVILTLLLLAGIAFASPLVQGLMGHITGSTVTATVTITPKHPKVTDSFVVTAVTGTPDPGAHQVKARFLSYTSPSGSGSANATGSIQGANATGPLVFANIGNGVQVPGGILTGADGVQVSFGSFFLPFGSQQIIGTAVNQGRSGNIAALDINGPCCGSSSIHVRNTTAFSGGRDAVPNSIITQNDITTATNNLISSLTPAAQTALQQQVQSGEQVLSGSLKCAPNSPTPNQRVGDQARSVTVSGTVTCKEEVYDQKGALSIAVDALKAEAAKSLGSHYVLVGTVVASVRPPTSIDAKNSISLVVDAQGQWVYQFSDADLTALKNKIAKESQSAAQADVNKTAGVDSAVIKISSGSTMPDAANITITLVSFPPISGSPTPGKGSPTTTPGTPTTPTGSPAITPTTGLGNGQTATPTSVLGGS